METLTKLARSISPNQVHRKSDEERESLHIAAVLVSNFTNHLYVLAEDYCRKEGLDFSLLYPLIRESAERIIQISPGDVQTGPAARNDVDTIKKHLHLLSDHPELKKLYQFLTESIIARSSSNHSTV